ncbi:hypothetical protein SAMN04490243_1608 [Robiginitalea myxolifaciens]|uniref:Uncharacterized protein n=1 Tax=Robiginitalea myxolifaciens TaxID=400055 RepID=A0A1I6GDF9_9FLAO|nr:hypothetical protein SAMN04490243_1608 [Robiginitalea myxolifaciens]
METYKTKSLIYFACFLMSASICYFVESNQHVQAEQSQTELAKTAVVADQLPAL